ncbi:MAG: hypothetical protein AAF578_01520 [Pseudomonadota bacterium]
MKREKLSWILRLTLFALPGAVEAQGCLEYIKEAENRISRNCADCMSGTQVELEQAVERLESLLTIESASTESLEVLTFGYRNLAYGYEPRTDELLATYEERLRTISDERLRRTPTDPNVLAEAARVAPPELRLEYSSKAYRLAKRDAAWAARGLAMHLLAAGNLDDNRVEQVVALFKEAYEMGDELVRKNVRVELKSLKFTYPEKTESIDEILN